MTTKRLSAVAVGIAVSAIALLAGCSKNEEPITPPKGAAASKSGGGPNGGTGAAQKAPAPSNPNAGGGAPP
jgi:hypothetical protein